MKYIFIILTLISCNYQASGKYIDSDKTIENINGLGNDEKITEINRQFEEYKESFLDVTNISPSHVSNISDAIFLDVREDDEYEVSMIPGAITLKEFSKNEDFYKDKTVVVYCTIGYRSGLFTKELMDKGFRAYNLKGGVLLWSHAMKDFLKDGVVTKKVHVYGRNWDLLNASYEAVY